jgi:hypothetical protein
MLIQDETNPQSTVVWITDVSMLGICYILCMCVCVGASGSTTASDDPSSSALFVSCVSGSLPRGVPGGARYAPLGYAQHSTTWAVARGSAPKFFFFFLFLADFAIFSGFLN